MFFFLFQMTAFTDQTLGLLSHLVFVRQLQAMQEFFHACQTAVNTYGSYVPSYHGVDCMAVFIFYE